MPLLIAVSTLFTAFISTVGVLIGRKTAHIGEKNEKSINEIHVIVNSQKTEMLREIVTLKDKSDNLHISNEELKKMILDMSRVFAESKHDDEEVRRVLADLHYLKDANRPS